MAGLVIGKIVGIGGASWLALRTGMGRLSPDVRFGHILGAGAVGGIGFTVSLFVTGLAFDDPGLQTEAKIGVLAGSLIAGLSGALILLRQPITALPVEASTADSENPAPCSDATS